MWRNEALLLDIVLAASDAELFVRDLHWHEFEASRLHQNAVIRSLEIIGEAAGRLSADFRAAHAGIPWHDIVAMRHRLVHAYNAVRLDILWDVVKNRLPLLVAEIKPLIPPDD